MLNLSIHIFSILFPPCSSVSSLVKKFLFSSRTSLKVDAQRKETAVLFMVIERFRQGDAKAVYKRFREQGRMLPDGLKYIESWTEANFERCFQLMECEDPQLFKEWMSRWEDLVEFEIITVISSKEAANLMTQVL